MGVGDSVDEVVQPQDSHPELLDGHSNEAARVTIGKQEITVQLFNATSDIGEIGEIVVRVFQLSRNRVAVGLNLLQAIVGKLEVPVTTYLEYLCQLWLSIWPNDVADVEEALNSEYRTDLIPSSVVSESQGENANVVWHEIASPYVSTVGKVNTTQALVQTNH
ncbi:unnamed protein product [Aphanomyces euteiches]